MKFRAPPYLVKLWPEFRQILPWKSLWMPILERLSFSRSNQRYDCKCKCKCKDKYPRLGRNRGPADQQRLTFADKELEDGRTCKPEQYWKWIIDKAKVGEERNFNPNLGKVCKDLVCLTYDGKRLKWVHAWFWLTKGVFTWRTAGFHLAFTWEKLAFLLGLARLGGVIYMEEGQPSW